MLRVFKTRNFAKWARKEKISDYSVLTAVTEMQRGLVDADLGGGLIKKRIARLGFGKRRSYRSLIAFRTDKRVVFLFGFAKKDRENLDEAEKVIYKKLADHYLKLSDEEIEILLTAKELLEVQDEKNR